MNSAITPPQALDQLAERMDALEQRVLRLELQGHEPANEQPAAPAAAVPLLPLSQPALAPPVPDFTRPGAAIADEPGLNGRALTTAGIALLGIAGAYLLRALSGTALLPRPLGASLAALYGAGWAWLAFRNRSRNPTGAILYAFASILMLAPMLWEMCIRFHAMPPIAAAALLAGYTAAVAIFARGHQRAAWVSILYAGSAVIALALTIGVRQMLPFAAILLSMSAWSELSRLRREPFAIGSAVILAADSAAVALLLIYRLPPASRPEYPQLPAAVVLAVPLLLLALHAAAVAVRVCTRDERRHNERIGNERISIFDTLQVSLALVLTGAGLLWLLPKTGQPACGALCIAAAAACYAAAFARPHSDARNFAIFATWGPALLVCAVFLLLGTPAASAALALLALAAASAAPTLRSQALAWHAVLYIALAEGASGTFAYMLHAISGSSLAPLSPFMVLAAIAAAAAYAAGRESTEDGPGLQALHLIAALLAAWPLNALLTHGLVHAASQFLAPSAFHVALVRTIALCGLAILLALIGTRLRRLALVRAAYTLTAFAALKLFFEDLRHGHLEFAAGSICLVALALIAIPRVAAKHRPTRENLSS